MNEGKLAIKPVNLLTSFLTLFVFVTIDYFSIGCKMFSVEGLKNFPSTAFFSGTVFLLTTYLAQIAYTCCSSITTGVAASIIFEAVLISRKISESCFSVLSEDNTIVRPADLYTNIFICMGISTALFSILSMVPYLYKAGNHLKDLPLLAIFSVMTAIGISIFNDAIGEYLCGPLSLFNISLLGIALFAGFTIFILEQAFPNFAFLVPLSSVLVVLAFNLLFRVFIGQPTERLQKDGLLPDLGKDANLRIWDILSIFEGGRISYTCIFSNLSNIFSLVLFNLIHINTNLLPYSYVTKGHINFNVEWRAQSISNFLTMFSGFPSYFVSSTSMIFYRAGGKSRASSAVGILVPALLAILAPYMRDYIPNILSSIILSYISMSFIYSYFIGPYRLLSNADFVIVVLGVVFCKAVSFAAGFAIVTAVCAISVLRFYGNTIGIRKDLQRPTENVVCVDYILCFITIGKLKQDLAACSQEVTLDLTACPYIDANGNMFILEYSQEVKRIQIIGNPYNLYKDRLNAQPNIHVLDTRY